ncbi:tetratricopeptide repeat protein [uncultured Tenacibaculum sp.]|uniref:tetratricopeptide repeat protein n=1 Tax=uncultured Tenacibaculum sp. TaxID=174713 RepID=UPI002604F07D|nr:tetratricopeptide repeat protein [uncultured Tenacibaculum sp.]
MRKRILLVVIVILFIKAEAQTSAFKAIDSLTQIGRYKVALTKLKEQPVSFEAENRLANIFYALDHHTKAISHYKKALTLKDDYKTKIRLGKSLLIEKRIQEAVKLYEDICTEDSNNLLAKYTLGKMYLKVRQYKKARLLFQELIMKDDSNANYYYQYALANPQPKKIFKRIDYYLLAYKKNNQHFNAIEKLARGFTTIKDRDSANIFIEKGLKIRPNHMDLNRLKINRLFIQKKYKESLALLLNIDSIQPNELYTKKMLGRCYFNLEEYDKAKTHFQKASQLDTEEFKSLIYLGDIALIEKDTKSAMFLYMRATRRGKKKRDRAYMGLANVFTEMKMPKDVLTSYKSAVEENPKNRKALFEYAKQTDNYYKDKKQGYKLYQRYKERFEGKDSITDIFVEARLKQIKKDYFFKGEEIE